MTRAFALIRGQLFRCILIFSLLTSLAIGVQPAASVIPSVGRNYLITDLDLTLIWIAPGCFAMGSPSGGGDDERPVTQVTMTAGYWLGRTEVTQAQWQALMGKNASVFKKDNNPVENVSWYEVLEFCEKLTQRERAAGRLSGAFAYTLPTEAQWEYACRAGAAGDHRRDLNVTSWHLNNSNGETHAVGTKQANAWGLFDMQGNVCEWCADWYHKYPGGEVTNPVGPARGSLRVHRGGFWGYATSFAQAAYRDAYEPYNRDHTVGFRLALTAVQ